MVDGTTQETKSYAEIIELVEQKNPKGQIIRVYPYDHLLSLRDIGLKIAPIMANAYAFNIKDLISKDDFESCPLAEGGPLKFLYLNPQFWTEERLKEEHWRFEGVRVLPGKTYIYQNGKITGPYRLYILDVDSFRAYEKLKELLETDFFLNTYVTESHKTKDGITFGYHVYWLEDWNEDEDCVNILPEDCKAGGEFEIFTGVKYTQIAGHHREHASFYYHNVGCTKLKGLQLMHRNGLYDKLLSLLKGLLSSPDEIAKKRKAQKKYKDPFYRGRIESDERDSDFLNADTHTLNGTQIGAAIKWALPFYGAETNDSVKHYYHFSTSFIATLVRLNITGKSIKKIMDTLYDVNPDSKYSKEKWHSWCDSSLLLWKEGGAVYGIPSLIKQVEKNAEFGDQEAASKHVSELLDILNLNKENSSENKSSFKVGDATNYEKLRELENAHYKKLSEETITEKQRAFAFNCMFREAPHDTTAILQLIHGCFSAFSNLSISHVLSSLFPGAGKNYLIRLIISYIPENCVVAYHRLSDKALFHIRGQLVFVIHDVESGREIVEPIEGHLNELQKEHRKLQRKNKKSQDESRRQEELEDEIKAILSASQNLIDLSYKIQIFLDTPSRTLFNLFMSLLSQDTPKDQIYSFADRVATDGINTRNSRLHGVPTVISAGVIDDTADLRFAEKNRRLVHVNPSSTSEKISEAIRKTNDERFGTPEEYDELYISRDDKATAQHIIKVMLAKIREHCKQFSYQDNGVWLPRCIREAISNALKTESGKVWNMTINDRLDRYLSIITLQNIDSRFKLVDRETNQTRIIASAEDLEETLKLMNAISSQIRPYVVDFYNRVIIPTYKENPKPNRKEKRGKVIEESERGITSAQIKAYLVKHKKTLKLPIMSEEDIMEKYMNPLSNQGVLNKMESDIDGRSKIFAPIEGYETGIITLFEKEDDSRLVVSKAFFPTLDKIKEDLKKRISVLFTREHTDILTSRCVIEDPKGQMQDLAEMSGYLARLQKYFKIFESWTWENRRKTEQKTCLGQIFGYLEGQSLENPNIVNDFTINQNTHLEKSNTDIQKNETRKVPEGYADLILVPPETSKIVPIFPDSLQLNIDELNKTIASSILQIKDNVKTLVPPKISNFERFGSFDFEWYRSDLQSNIDAGIAGLIYCAAFVDNLGNATTLHLKDFNANYENFINAVLTEMGKYSALIGFSILEKESSLKKKGGISGDIETLEKNCNAMTFDIKEKFANLMFNVKMLDIYPLFTSEHTKGILSAASKIRLRGDSLDAISTMYLGEGKLEDLSGPEVEPLEPDVQKLYCLQDAILPLKLIQKENFKLLNIFSNLAQECDLDPYRALNHCNTTTFWRGLLKKWEFMRISTELTHWQDNEIERDPVSGSITKGINYLGGEVLIPAAVGKFTDIVVWDVASMYPTMAIIHNISPETVMCDCCRNDPEAKITDEIMQYINDGLTERNKKEPGKGYAPRPFHYWICVKQRGILPQIMEDLFKKKSEYKRSKRTSEEKGVKIAANSGYGVFANKFYEGYNIAVAELITGFARYALLGLKKEIENLGFSVIYGDTDSLFIKDIRPDAEKKPENFSRIVELAQSQYQVEFEKDKVFKVFFIPSKKDEILTPSQKQYFGLLDNGEVHATTLVGMKSNYPKYFRNVMLKLITPEVVGEFYTNSADGKMHVMEIVREVFSTFDKEISSNIEFIIRNLGRSEDNSKPLSKYPNNGWQKQIFNEVLDDCKGDRTLAEQKTRAHMIIPFWRIKPIGKGANRKVWTCHPDKYELDRQDSKRLLWGRVKPILDSYLFSKEECKRIEAEVMGTFF